MSQPIVSIIIPTCNAARWLGATLRSAVAQTWPAIEIIVVDDGSTDESVAVARSFGRQGIRIVEQPHRGASVARNTGLRAATGAFVQFLDADDLLAPDKVARQLAVLGADRRHVASGEWARFTTSLEEAVFEPEPNWCDFTGLDFMLLHYHEGWMMHPAAWLCPRGIVEIAGPWDERLTLNDDGEFFCRVMLASAGIRFCPGARSYYRTGVQGSLSRRKDEKALRSLFLSLELNTSRLLAFEDSPRVRAAVADAWQHFAYEVYPAVPDLVAQAERLAQESGGARRRFPGGPKFHALARLTGWRMAKRVRLALSGR